MIPCPTQPELQELLADRLPAGIRSDVEGHIESCPVCQGQLDALTKGVEWSLASQVADQKGPAFLDRLQENYPATLIQHETQVSSSLKFPGEVTERAPLGQVGDFEILEEIGSGSFGWVFRARERSLDRIVALKVLKPEMTARADAITRFEREARKASLKHDHIVNVYRFEKPANFPPYLVMEFVEGQTLDARLKCEGKLPPEEAVAIAREIALGLAAAHERGMVHRDIKPANILLEGVSGGVVSGGVVSQSTTHHSPLHHSLPRAKISDFGLARDIDNESLAVTAAGEMAGTAPYMSPEHFRAPEQVDGRSDLFSLGVVLYQMLTGQLPFKGTFLQIRTSILEDEPIAPRKLHPGVPVDLETITMECLEKDPVQRYQSAAAVAEDLRRFQQGETILVRPAGPVERVRKWAYRKPAQAALALVGTACVLTLVGLAVGLFWSAQLQASNANLTDAKNKLESTNSELSQAKQKLESTNADLGSEKARVERLNYIADMNLAHQAWQHDNFELLEQFLRTHEKSNLRGFEWHYLRWLSKSDGQRIGPQEPISAVAWDAQGCLLGLAVQTTKGAEIQLWSPPTSVKPRGELWLTLPGEADAVLDLVFHPGKECLFSSDGSGTITMWDFKYKQPKRTLTIAGTGPLAISSDGETLAHVRGDGAIQRLSITKQQVVGAPLIFDAGGGAASDDGKSPRLPSRDPDAGKRKSSKPGDRSGGRGIKTTDAGIKQLVFSPDGRRLAAVGGFYKVSGRLAVWDLASGQRVDFADAQKDDVFAGLAYSPDGGSIAAVGYDHSLRVWDAATGKLRFRNAAHKLEGLAVSFNVTGDMLATAGWDKVVKIWNARTGEEMGTLRGNRDVVGQVLFRPSQIPAARSQLVSLNVRGELRWWDVSTEQTARVIRHSEPGHSLAFSPRGRFLASFGRNSQALVVDLTDAPWDGLPSPSGQPRKAVPPVELTVNTMAGRGLWDSTETSLLVGGASGPLQAWRVDDKVAPMSWPVAQKSWFSSSRIVAIKDRQFWVSPQYPNAEAPWANLTAFGPSPAEAPQVVAVDQAGERLAYPQPDRTIVIAGQAFQPDSQAGKPDLRVTKLKLPAPIYGGSAVNAMALSPDGKLLAVDTDYDVLLFDTESGVLRHRLTGHLCVIGCLAFSPDGKRLASGSEDWTIKLWDLEVGRATLTLTGHKGRIRDLAFSPDGATLASISEDSTVRLWQSAALGKD